MTKNIHTITIEEEHNGDKDLVSVDWRELYTRKSWRADRGNVGTARQILEQMALLLGVSVYVKEEDPVGVSVAYKGKTN